MMRFWLLMFVLFAALVMTVNHVSRRASQEEAAEPPRRPFVAAQDDAAASYQPPRSYAPEATVDALYKCVDAQGHHSFQSQPCPGDSTQAWVRDATPEPEPSRDELLRRAHVQQQAGRSDAEQSTRQVYATGSASAPPDPAKSAACQMARAADAAYRRQPLRYVTHDGLRRHGDRINEACY